MTVWDKTALYKVANSNYWLDGNPGTIMDGEPEFVAYVNSKAYTDLNPIYRTEDYRTQGRFESILNVDKVKDLRIGSGVLMDVVY
jgi:hypothetical protein